MVSKIYRRERKKEAREGRKGTRKIKNVTYRILIIVHTSGAHIVRIHHDLTCRDVHTFRNSSITLHSPLHPNYDSVFLCKNVIKQSWTEYFLVFFHVFEKIKVFYSRCFVSFPKFLICIKCHKTFFQACKAWKSVYHGKSLHQCLSLNSFVQSLLF